MPFKCPNCDTVHEKVAGYVSQEVLTQRLAAKTEEIKTLTATLEKASTDAADIGAIRADRDAARAELAELRDAHAISEAFTAHGIADDADLRTSFRTMYASAVAGADEAPSFIDWLASDQAKGHVLLRGHYGAQTAAPAVPTEEAKPAQPANSPVRAVPNTNAGTVPTTPTAPAKLTTADWADVFESPAYKALDYKKRRALRQQWQADIAAGRGLTRADLDAQIQAG